MLRSLARSAPRRVPVSKPPSIQAPQRFLRIAPQMMRTSQQTRNWRKKRNWIVFKCALAVGAVVVYNNIEDIFADRFSMPIDETPEQPTPPTLESIAEEKRLRQVEKQAQDVQTAEQNQREENNELQGEELVEELEAEGEESDQQGAFNPETGEINWDCPCLGGMAHGPCGEEFKAAFSCFVYSKEDPKGMECIEKFKDMQSCFREHPETYASELADDDDEEEIEEKLQANSAAKETEQSITSSLPSANATVKETEQSTTSSLPSAEAVMSPVQKTTPQIESGKSDLERSPR